MDEHIVERRVQLRGKSLVLTIPTKIAAELGLRRGQSVRFILEDGGFTVRPTSVTKQNLDSDICEDAISNMMRGASSETSAGETYIRRP